MKLIKLTHESFKTPCVERVTEFFSRDLEEISEAKYILVSDVKFRQLELAGIKMHVYSSYDEPTSYDLTNMDREEYYIVKEILDPNKFDPETINIAKYDLGDVVFFHLEEDEKGYSTAKDLPVFNAVGIICNPSYKLNDEECEVPLRVFQGKKLWIAYSLKFETTKDEDQFTINGKRPRNSKTKVGNTVGGFTAGESIKGMSWKKILTKLFGLQKESDPVGKLLPPIEPPTPVVPVEITTPSINYGEGSSSVSAAGSVTVNVTCTADSSVDTTTATVSLYRNEVEVANLIESKEYNESLAFNVTGGHTNGDKFIAVVTYTDEGEEMTTQSDPSAALIVE